MYGKDPQNAEDLQPAYPEPSFSDLVQQLINLSIDPQSETGRNQDNAEIHALNARHVRQQYKPIESDRVAGEHVESVGISLVEGEMQGDLCSAAIESSCSGFDAQDLKGEKSETEQDAELEIEILGPRQFWSECSCSHRLTFTALTGVGANWTYVRYTSYICCVGSCRCSRIWAAVSWTCLRVSVRPPYRCISC
jgi:hypothetical protein